MMMMMMMSRRSLLLAAAPVMQSATHTRQSILRCWIASCSNCSRARYRITNIERQHMAVGSCMIRGCCLASADTAWLLLRLGWQQEAVHVRSDLCTTFVRQWREAVVRSREHPSCEVFAPTLSRTSCATRLAVPQTNPCAELHAAIR